MQKFVTLTWNWAIDKSGREPQLGPEQKLRCNLPVAERGGGINVARARAPGLGLRHCRHHETRLGAISR